MSQSEIASEVLLPSMGEGIVEATLVKWLRKEGQEVSKGDPLLEVSTDKVDTEIPAPHSGVLLKASAKEGSTVEVNSVIGWIGAIGSLIPEGTALTSKSSNHSSSKSRPSPSPTQPNQNTRTKISTGPVLNSDTITVGSYLQRTSPLVRKMAKDMGIDVRQVPGTGLNGRITRPDLERFAESPAAWGTTQQNQPVQVLSRVKTITQDGVERLEGVSIRRETMSKMRRIIAEHMVESVRVSPHVTTTFEIDMSAVAHARERLKAQLKSQSQVNLTYTHFLIHAAVQAIKLHPIVNVSVDGDDILWKDSINIGCAVALGSEGGGGLIVPVIKNAESMSLTDIALRLTDLADKARTKKLAPDDVKGGTFSVTNPGGWGSITSNPIINQPQVAMLGIGAIVKRAVVSSNDQIVVRPMMMASLTFDHRVIDGEGGAQWLATYKKILESYSITD